MKTINRNAKVRRVIRIRAKLQGTASRPRLSVNRSNMNLQAQLIDDQAKVTLLGMSTLALKLKGTKLEKAVALGTALAQGAKAKKISEVLFDRGPSRYTGRIKALADAARTGGLKF